MPRVLIPVTVVSETGTSQPSAVTGVAADDHYLVGDSDCIVECKNTSGGNLDVTFVTTYVTSGGLALEPNARTVAGGATMYFLLGSNAVRRQYHQEADSDRIHVDITSNAWEFRAYAI